MKLLTNELRKHIPPLYATEYDPDPMVWVKFFWPWGSWTYYVLEFDGVDILFGWVQGVDFPELGYSSLAEIERLEGPWGLRVERDRYFTPCRLSDVTGRPVKAVRVPEPCAYGDDSPAVKGCVSCARPLCSFCGARDQQNRVYCNECFAEVGERALATAPPEDDTEPPGA